MQIIAVPIKPSSICYRPLTFTEDAKTMKLKNISTIPSTEQGIQDALVVKIMERSPEWQGTIQPMLRIAIADDTDVQQCICYNRDADSRMQVGNTFVVSNYFIYDDLVQIRKTTKLYK